MSSVQSHKRLQELNSHGKPAAGSTSQDCSICLGPIAVSGEILPRKDHISDFFVYSPVNRSL